MTPGNPAYNIPVAYRIRGAPDIALLELSVNQIVQRHEVWRTTFREFEGDAIQEIHPESRIRISTTDLGQVPTEDREREAERLVAQEAIQPFDLCQLPLLRVSLFKLDDHNYVLLINFHHIVGDGVSVNLLFNELDLLYRSAIAGTTPALPELTVQYADFAAWQRAELLRTRYSSQLEYWRRQFEKELPVLEFATGERQLLRQSFSGSNVNFSLPRPLVQALMSLGLQESGTLFITILTAIQVILLRYSMVEEIVIGTPIANRPLPEVDRSIGNFVNVVALRCDLSGNPLFLELLRRNKEVALNSLTNKDIPFELLVENLKSHHRPGHNPIFQILLQILPASHVGIGDLSVTPFDFELKATQTDLALHLYEQAGGEILARLQYCKDLFAAETIEGLSRNFAQLLEEICRNPHQKILEIPIPALPLTSDGRPEQNVVPDAGLQAEPVRAYEPPRNSVQSHLIEIWEEVLQRKPIGIRDDYFELGGHSLLAAKIVSLISERLGYRLSFGEFFTKPTIENHALALTGAKSPARQSPSVAIHPAGTKTPVLFFHGDYVGGGFFCKTLASVIGTDRPFYAIHPHGLQGDYVPPTIEAMAADRLKVIREIQPRGPYILGGYCNGAFSAYHTARVLRAAGEEVTVLLMLYADGSNMRFRWLKRLTGVASALRGEDEAASLQRFLRTRQRLVDREDMTRYYLRTTADLIRRPSWEKAAPFLRRVGRLFGIKSAVSSTSARGSVPPTDARGAPYSPLGKPYADACNSFIAEECDAPVVLLWPREEKPLARRGPAAGWEKICRQIEVVEVPGHHHSCISQNANVVQTGQAMKKAIQQAESLLPITSS